MTKKEYDRMNFPVVRFDEPGSDGEEHSGEQGGDVGGAAGAVGGNMNPTEASASGRKTARASKKRSTAHHDSDEEDTDGGDGGGAGSAGRGEKRLRTTRGDVTGLNFGDDGDRYLLGLAQLERLRDVLSRDLPVKSTKETTEQMLQLFNVTLDRWTELVRPGADVVIQKIEEALGALGVTKDVLDGKAPFKWFKSAQPSVLIAREAVELAVLVAGRLKSSGRQARSTAREQVDVDFTDEEDVEPASGHGAGNGVRRDGVGTGARGAGWVVDADAALPDMASHRVGTVLSFVPKPGQSTPPLRCVRLPFRTKGVAMSAEYGAKHTAEPSSPFTCLLASRLGVAEIVARDHRVRDAIVGATFTTTAAELASSPATRAHILSGSVPSLTPYLPRPDGNGDLTITAAMDNLVYNQRVIFGNDRLVDDLESTVQVIRVFMSRFSNKGALVVQYWNESVELFNEAIREAYRYMAAGDNVSVSGVRGDVNAPPPLSPFTHTFRSFCNLVRGRLDRAADAMADAAVPVRQRSSTGGYRKQRSWSAAPASRSGVQTAPAINSAAGGGVETAAGPVSHVSVNGGRRQQPGEGTQRTGNDGQAAPVCWHWQRRGSCKKGDQCLFSHDGAGASAGGGGRQGGL